MRKVLVGLFVAAMAALVARRLQHLAAVAPHLRRASILLPISVNNTLVLRIGRLLVPNGDHMLHSSEVRHVHIPGGQDAYLHEPRGRKAPTGAVLWLHGGGLVGGRPELEQTTARRLSQELGVPVLNVRYRLAPEHPFPAASDDVFAALTWLHEQADELGIDADRIAVAGESAGAGLAAGLAQRAVDAGMPVVFQALIYPMIDDRTVLEPDHEGRGAFIWTPSSNRYAWTSYLGHRPTPDPLPPYAAPARRDDLSGLPPTWIGVGDLDIFYQEDVEYARRLRDAGVAVEELIVPGMYHGADELAADEPEMKAFRQSMVDALGRALG